VGILYDRKSKVEAKSEMLMRAVINRSRSMTGNRAIPALIKAMGTKRYPEAMMRDMRGSAIRLRMSGVKAIRLKADAVMGIIPNCAVNERTRISLIFKGSLGRCLIITGKKRTMDKVAAKVI
jgi:hypothetical protein